jgi:hypothetical protein
VCVCVCVCVCCVWLNKSRYLVAILFWRRSPFHRICLDPVAIKHFSCWLAMNELSHSDRSFSITCRVLPQAERGSSVTDLQVCGGQRIKCHWMKESIKQKLRVTRPVLLLGSTVVPPYSRVIRSKTYRNYVKPRLQQTPVNHPEESIQRSWHGESLISRI